MGLPFTCIPAMIDETPPVGLTPRQAAEELARRKALAVAKRSHSTPSPWIFAADTIVVLENEIFGKPADRDDARRMLERLAGRRHEVITAMALYNGRLKTTDCRSKTSEVAFAPLAGAEIEWYLDTGEWEGTAGAYRRYERKSPVDGLIKHKQFGDGFPVLAPAPGKRQHRKVVFGKYRKTVEDQ
jgi:septum formation protein